MDLGSFLHLFFCSECLFSLFSLCDVFTNLHKLHEIQSLHVSKLLHSRTLRFSEYMLSSMTWNVFFSFAGCHQSTCSLPVCSQTGFPCRSEHSQRTKPGAFRQTLLSVKLNYQPKKLMQFLPREGSIGWVLLVWGWFSVCLFVWVLFFGG